jgi:hypothetical protein
MAAPQISPASDVLREKRKAANWSRLFASPIRLEDGAVLFTLKDAAEKILNAPASPSCRVAAQRIIDAALKGGDMASVQAAVRLALLKKNRKLKTADRDPRAQQARRRDLALYAEIVAQSQTNPQA